MINVLNAPQFYPTIRFSVETDSGKTNTYGIFSREDGQTLKFVQYKSGTSNEYQTIETFCEQTDSQKDVIREISCWLYENSEMETEEDSDQCEEITKAALAVFFITYGR